ncbi:MAG: hypothetical protein ABW007_26095 [Chitinophagaceae bacterium]
MKPKSRPCYHCFLLLSGWNLVGFYLFIAHHPFRVEKLVYFDDPLFSYFFFVSLSILLTWLTYFLCREKLTSKRLMGIHILITAVIVFPLPWIVTYFADTTTALLSTDDPSALESLFHGHSRSFLFIIMILLLSDLLLLANITRTEKA